MAHRFAVVEEFDNTLSIYYNKGGRYKKFASVDLLTAEEFYYVRKKEVLWIHDDEHYVYKDVLNGN